MGPRRTDVESRADSGSHQVAGDRTGDGARQGGASVHRLPLDTRDDAAVARAALADHPDAAAAVWDRFSPLVRGILRRAIGPHEDVEDQVQEVFLRFFRQLPTLRDVTAVRSFLFGIAIRVAHTELRRRRVRRWLRLTDSGTLPDVPAGDDAGDDAREALERLYAILDRMDSAGRLAFVLRHIEGLELTEIASALDVSLATAKRRLAHTSDRVLTLAARDPVLVDYVVTQASGEGRDV